MADNELQTIVDVVSFEETSPPIILGGLIGDTFKLFFSDHNVIAAIVVTIIIVSLLIIATKFLRR